MHYFITYFRTIICFCICRIEIGSHLSLHTFFTRRLAGHHGNSFSSNEACTFDRMRGEDAWLGREVRKKFWIGKGSHRKQVLFKGKVTAIDDDEDNEGHRVFVITYEDGDEEIVAAGDIAPYLGPFESDQVGFSVCYLFVILMRLFCIVYCFLTSLCLFLGR